MERFEASWSESASGCWDWLGSVGTRGYGRIGVGGKMLQAHRFAYEQLVGPIADGLVLDHLCNNKRCVNPAHLEPVTVEDNVRRGVIRSMTAEELRFLPVEFRR